MAERLAASGLAANGRARANDALGGRGVSMSNEQAGLRIRLLAYLLDSVVLFAFTMLFATASFLNIFLRSDYGEGHVSDGAGWTSVAILMAAIPAWLAANLALLSVRGQTVGQYVLGLGVVTEAGVPPRLGRLVLYWLALHPLLYHPVFSGFWLLFAFAALGLSENAFAVAASLAIALLCLLAPLGGLLFASLDPRRRAIHDRLAGIRVVHLA